MELKKLKGLLPCLFVLVLLSPLEGWAQKKLIHYWDMNNTLPSGGNAGVSVSPLAAEYSTLGHAYLVYDNFATTATSCNCPVRDSIVDNGSGGSTLNDRHVLGNDTGGTSGGNLYIRTRNPMNNMQFLWYMPTTGYQNLLLSYVSELSSAGKPVQNYSYSLDSGLTFITTGLPMTSYTAGIAWGLQTVDLSAIAGANNNPKFVFSISYSGAAAQATSGNDRYDNITLEGDSICPSFTLQPTSQTICEGSSAYFLTHVAGGVNNTYQWQVNTGSGFASINNGGVYSGVNSDSLVLTGVPVGMTNYQYQCIVSSGTCGNISTKSNVKLMVNPSVTVTVNTASVCIGSSSTLTANGANSYTWSPATGLSSTSGASVTVNPTVTTSYTIVGTNVGACADLVTTTVTVNSLPVVSISGSTSMCSGQSELLTAQGANTYTWVSGPTTSTYVVSPSSYTSYSVTGTDINNCSKSASISIIVKTSPNVSVNSSTICIGANTVLTASGANAYKWSPASGLSNTIGSTTTATPTASTTYTVTGSSTNGCKNIATSTITINPLPIININSPTICVGSTATLTASGASSYTWNTNATTTSISPSPTITTTYTVSGIDGNSCKNIGTGTVLVNPLPIVNVNTATICVGATTTLTASGANSYTWNTNETTTSISPSPTITTTYSVTGTDGNNCNNTGTGTVIVNPLPILTINSPSICIGGTATLTAGGAVTYTWTTGATTGSTTASPTVATSYSVSGTDGNNCTNIATTNVAVNSLPTLSVNTSTICIGATATLTASGANTYTWNTTAVNASITPSPNVTTTYTVTGTDGNNCKNTGTSTVTVNLLPVISVNAAAICVGSIATLTADGANTYTWSTGATGISISPSPTVTTTYTATGTDGNNCINTGTGTVTVNSLPTISVNSPAICAGITTTLTATGANTYTWNTGATSTSITSSPTVTTTYTVSGTDANNCTNTGTTVVSINSTPTLSISGVSAICLNGTTTLTANGATTYTWSPASGLNSISGTSVVANPIISTTYTLTGSNGCVNTTVTTVTVNPLPTFSVSSSTVCAGSTATLTANGTPVSYVWSAGINGASITPSPSLTTTYTVVGTDVNNCSNAGTTTVTVNELPVIAILGAPAVCVGGSESLLATGAVTYTWTSGETTANISISPTANTTTYSVSGTDANNCVNKATKTITLSSTPTITINAASICKGQQTATLTASSNATSFVWNPATGLSSTAGVSVTANPTVTTTYTITGSNGCVNSATTTVRVDTLPKLIIPQTAGICIGQTATLTASGATSYTWTTGTIAASTTVAPSINTTYTVIGTDAHTCTNTAVQTVTVNVVSVTINEGTASIMINSGSSVTLDANGATSYTWSTNETGASVTESPKASTQYCVVGSVNNCRDTSCISVTVDQVCGTVYIPDAFSPNGDGANDVFRVYGGCINELTLQIFDRWGNKVFETTNVSIGWDGTFNGSLMNTGTYIYQAAYTLNTGEKDKTKGNFILMR